jgi:tRNA nucleotidyltransferase/poly(A) polymerase
MKAGQDITLNEAEQSVFKILLDTVKHFDLDIIVRAAGGWVRDKLLGVESDDIDIVIDKVSGEEFALKVSQFMTDTAQAGCSRIGTVKQNPDQSKHLATACFSISGISLDVNNLRTETYTVESRIPKVSIGTACEDAHRRDFTINSLFYNLKTGAVEDFIGVGREDLRLGIIRTPLPPEETFQDDPLRLLRAVRFAARLDYQLHTDTLEAMKSSAAAKLLLTKVSRERLGIEIDKMFTAGCKKPIKALLLLDSTGLLPAVFMPSDLIEEASTKPADLQVGISRAKLAIDLLGAQATKQDVRVVAYSGLLSPWKDFRYKEKNRQLLPLIRGLLRLGLRLPNDLSDVVLTIVNAACRFSDMNQAGKLDNAELWCRSSCGQNPIRGSRWSHLASEKAGGLG